jgi:hypothetical protein
VKNVAQLRGRDFSREFERTRQRGMRVPQQSSTNFNTRRPLRMTAYGFDECRRRPGFLHRVNYRRFGDSRIFQRRLPDARFLIEQKRGADFTGRSTRERDALT